MKNKKRWKIILAIVIILLLANVGYYLVTNWQNFPIIKSLFPKAGETVDLKTYSSSKLGFQIQYPTSWIIKDDGNTVEVNPPTEDGITYFSVGVRSDFQSLEDVKKTLASSVVVTPVQFNNASGFEYTDSENESIWLSNSNKIYLVRTYSSPDVGDVASQILTTFKFTN